MRIVHTSRELQDELRSWRTAGETVALVPTMGNLHRGHLSLVDAAREAAPRIVVSIFVNPLQFAPGEDFERYPRTLEADTALLKAGPADLLFTPSTAAIYPNGFPPVTVVRVSGGLTDQLDGASRPGHFEGVATVVNILFNQVQPDFAIFGAKDYQQLAVIRRMVSDLGISIGILSAPTTRDPDGLALSSRNQYLSQTERAMAPALRASIVSVAGALKQGIRDFTGLCTTQSRRLQNLGFRPDYLQVRALDLSPPREDASEYVVLAAAWLGRTRLIDNEKVNIIKDN